MESYVAFLDILGFKQIVDNNHHQALESLYDTFSDYIVTKTTELSDKYALHEGLGKVHCTIVSDSIVMWTENTNVNSFVHLSILVSKMLVAGFMADMPLRGGISKGEITVKETNLGRTIFGKALTEAYTLETIQQWSGCVIKPGIIEECMADHQFKDLLENDFHCIQYDVPTKTGSQKFWCLNWPLILVRNPEDFRPMFEKHGKNISTEREEQKLHQTVDFYKTMITLYSDYQNYFLKNREQTEIDKDTYISTLETLGYTSPQYDVKSGFGKFGPRVMYPEVKDKLMVLKIKQPDLFKQLFENIEQTRLENYKSGWLKEVFVEVKNM